MKKIGLQLYSIKELLQKNFLGTLAEIGRMGYDGVEFAGYYNSPAKELKKALDEYGLQAAGSHVGIDQLQNSLQQVIEYNLEIKNPYIVCPGLPIEMRNNSDAYKRTAELFNRIGEICKANELQFAYHNHAFEFEKFDGQFGFDILASNTQPELLHLELDTFWVEYAGLRSIDFMNKYGERCSLLHIKDMKSFDHKINTEIGKGVMDFKGIISLGKRLNTSWYIVEQEEFDIPQLQSIQESLQYLKGII